MKKNTNKLLSFFETRLNLKFVSLMVTAIAFISMVHVTYGVITQQRILEQRLQVKADALGEFVALVSPDAIYSFDITTLDQFVVQIMKDQEVRYAVITDAEHKRLTTVNPQHEIIQHDRLTHNDVNQWFNDYPDVKVLQYQISHLNKKLGYLHLVLDLSSLQGSFYKSFREHSLIGFLIAAILAMIIAYIFRRSVIAPILQLQAGARRVGQGNYIEPVKAISNDEIGELTTAFNQMMAIVLQEQAELVENNRELMRLTWAVEQSPASVVILDKDRLINYVNKSFVRGRGCSIESLTGKTLESLYPELESTEHFQDIWKLVSKGDVWHGELCYRNRTNEVCCEDVSIQAILDEQGEIVNYLSLMLDITQQKKTEELLRQTQKMDALGKLTGGVAHDFNNILGIILGYTELLKERLADYPELEEYVDNIYSGGERAQKLTSRLLSFSRNSPISAELVNMNQLIRDEKNLIEKSLTAKINLQLDLSEDIWPVYVDKSSMQDVILNLSINSMYAMPDGGSITISTGNCSIGSNEANELNLAAGDYLVLSVEDTGMGMSREVQDKMFDPFYTTKGNEGTGLGLSQVYGYMKQLSGGIHVSSTEGVGTKIMLYFHRARDEQNNVSAEDSAQQSVVREGNERILVVDDEDALREMTCELLSGHGYSVEGFSNAVDALDYLTSHTVDLILSDVIMPEMDGYQFAAEVSRLYPDMKIQMLSGFSESVQVGEQQKALRDTSLQKPFTSQELFACVRKRLD